MKIRNKVNIIVSIVAILMIAVGAVTNIKQLLTNIVPQIVNSNINTIKENISSAETNYQTNFEGRNSYNNLYGAVQKVINKDIIGNFEYIKDPDGVINMIKEDRYNVDQFVDNVCKVNEIAKNKNIPMMYVQGMNREMVKGKYPAQYSFNIDDATMDVIVDKLKRNNIDVLDEREQFLNSNSDIKPENVFLHTDLHMQTDAEIWVANNIAENVGSKYGLKFENAQYLRDMSNYTKKTFPMIGNYGRNTGILYSDVDSFDIYIPNFETDYSMWNGVDGSQVNGSFQQVVMNGYENNLTDEYTYWVTEYLKFGQPYYSVINNKNPNGPKILFITDSIGYRTISYTSLLASNVTVLDPRFFGGVDYYNQALSQQQYDLVIIYQGTFLTDVPFAIQ